MMRDVSFLDIVDALMEDGWDEDSACREAYGIKYPDRCCIDDIVGDFVYKYDECAEWDELIA